MTRMFAIVLGLPFLLAGFLWKWASSCFRIGIEFFNYLDDL